MAYFCIKGAGECTACGDCYSASVCDICGRAIRSKMKYYELSDMKVCDRCAVKTLADEGMVCFVCGGAVKENGTILAVDNRIVCKDCSEESERKKDYVCF